MAADNSFDVVSKVEIQEVKNAIDQATKEVNARLDLKNSKSTITLEGQALRSLDARFYLSFAGNVTYPKSTVIQAVAKAAPADRILVETDAPVLAPVPLRGQRNEPAHVALTAKFVAELRGVSAEEVAAQTTANFERLFPATAESPTLAQWSARKKTWQPITALT